MLKLNRLVAAATLLLASLPTMAAAAGFCCFLSASAADATVLRSYLAGLGTSNDGITPNSVLDIAAGQASDTTATTYINLASAITKSTAGAWASGTGQNGMGNGLTIAASTWYDVCLAYNGNSPDVWFDSSNRSTTYSECANRPTGISGTLYRRIGTFLTNGSSNIIAFFQFGDEYAWVTPIAWDVNNFVLLNTLHTFTLANIPSGFSVDAFLTAQFSRSAASNAWCVSPSVTGSLTASARYGNFGIFGSNSALSIVNQYIRTNSLAQINCISDQAASTTLFVISVGWIDRRGRDN